MLSLWIVEDELDTLAVSLGVPSVFELFRFLAEKYNISEFADRHFSLYIKFGVMPYYIRRELNILYGDN
jgi:hypothetical protein